MFTFILLNMFLAIITCGWWLRILLHLFLTIITGGWWLLILLIKHLLG